MEYCIAHKRELNSKERELIDFLLTDSKCLQYLPQVKSLKVVARCGCGSCPTILLGKSLNSEPVVSGSDITQYFGENSEGVMVGVTLMSQGGIITELEASSLSGENVLSWPSLHSLRKCGA